MRRPFVISLAAIALASPLAAQQPGGAPQRAENLKVLPKDTPRDTVIAIMRGISTSLGVRCTYCHVATQDSAGREQLQFARDDKPAKEKARAMMRMTSRINGELLPTVPDRRNPPVNVTCVTCHRTMPVPQTLAQVLDSAMTASPTAGADSTIALYRRLRANEGTSGRWDFGELTLGDLARGLAMRGKTAEAVALLELNAEQFPNSAQVDVQLAELYRTRGEKDKAIARYRMALTKQPNNQQVKRRLAELEGAK
jgi:tetratricopeptide (TPR) repeat protein